MFILKKHLAKCTNQMKDESSKDTCLLFFLKQYNESLHTSNIIVLISTVNMGTININEKNIIFEFNMANINFY